MRQQPTTCFRVERKRSDGTWSYLFDADFVCAKAAVRDFAERGIKARFVGSGQGNASRKLANRTKAKAAADHRMAARLTRKR